MILQFWLAPADITLVAVATEILPVPLTLEEITPSPSTVIVEPSTLTPPNVLTDDVGKVYKVR